MGEIKLLDCTLRDGGYLNDWEFGQDMISSIYERLVSTGVDVIEIGFLDERRKFDINRSIMPDTSSVEKIYGKMTKGNSMIVGMIDFGTCSIKQIQPCSESYLDGIRVIFKEQRMYDALKFCSQLKQLGYKVFAQLVSVTTYTDEKLLELIDIVNQVKPYALSMVDTYGLLHQNNLMHIFKILNQHLDVDIALGYHAHNNFQMGYANGVEILNTPVERTVLVDGTLYGMGKSAGNTPLELLAMYLNDNFGKTYDIGQMLEAIETNIIEIKQKVSWGYNLFYYVSAATQCHPNYVSYFMNKRTLSMKAINDLLLTLEEEKKLLYDQKYAEQKYLEFQEFECDDSEVLKSLKGDLNSKNILLLGPGRNMAKEKEKVQEYIREKHPIIVAINYIPAEIPAKYIFLTNSKRYLQIKSSLNETRNQCIDVIATSNVVKTSGNFKYELNYSNLIDIEASIPDNSLVMFLRVCEKIGVHNIALAGFDGYSESEMNYFNTNMEYSFVKDKANELNTYVKNYLQSVKNSLKIYFVTDSYYLE